MLSPKHLLSLTHVFRLWLALLGLASALEARAESESYAVLASATVQENPPQIIFDWPFDPGTPGFPVLDYEVYRKAKGTLDWGSPIATLLPSATGFTDTNVVVGQTYEYQFIKHTTYLTGYGYSCAGIRAPLIEDRGKLLLLVDNTYAADLASEITRLQRDLAGDGWTVLRFDINRTGSVSQVRNLIKTNWQQLPYVQAVFLFGHVPVPYSGNITPDGKPDHHKGAWPADVHYAELNGFWTDFFINNSTATDPRNHNIPGDGKFDQSSLFSDADVMVGRVDLANMPGKFTYDGPPTFPEEKELLRQYLNKDHAYRHRQFVPGARALVHDGAGARDGEAAAAIGWRAAATSIGWTNVEVDTNETFLQRVTTNSYLWAYDSDAGDFNSLGRSGGSGNFGAMNTAEMVSSNIQASFVCFYGSWLGDWDTTDNLLRGVLAIPSNGLASVYAGAPHWFFHHMALGEPIGYSTRLAQNNYPGVYDNQINLCWRQVHVALMGDPSLRLQMPTPPGDLSAVGTSNIVLSWNASPAATLGYHVYRSTTPYGYYSRLTSVPVLETNFTDFTAVRGTNHYMVRALKLETSASGTYTNASQGIFVEANASEAALGPARFSAQFFLGGEQRFQGLGAIGRSYTLFTSTNGVDWSSLGSQVATNSPFEFIDPNPPTDTVRFYRMETGQ